jgi:23S rRNA (pseudouridine1915-N3)-methyltransferase
MKIQIWTIGKNHEAVFRPGIEEFTRRIARYFAVEWKIIPMPKNAAALSPLDLKKKERDLVSGILTKEDYLVILDEKGKQMSSKILAKFIQSRANENVKQLVFLVGGAYGIDEALLKRADFVWSLSQLTFPHQLVRLILAEQVYRACSITRNEKYHHE